MSTFSGDTSPIPSFQRVLSACYCAEIDVQMQMIWDCGIRVAVAIRDDWHTNCRACDLLSATQGTARA